MLSSRKLGSQGERNYKLNRPREMCLNPDVVLHHLAEANCHLWESWESCKEIALSGAQDPGADEQRGRASGITEAEVCSVALMSL